MNRRSTTILSFLLTFAVAGLGLAASAAAQEADPEEGLLIPEEGEPTEAWDPYSVEAEEEEGEGDEEGEPEEEPAAPVGPLAAEADAPAATSTDGKSEKDKKAAAAALATGQGLGGGGFQISPSMTTEVGQGTFVSNEYAANPYWAWNLGISPTYTFENGLRVSANVGLFQELTNSDGDTSNQRVLLSDVSLNTFYSVGRIPGIDVGVNVSGGLRFPTSLASQAQTLITSGRVGVGLNRGFGPVFVGYSGAFTKNFHRYESPVVDIEDQDSSLCLARSSDNRTIDGTSCFVPGVANTNFSVSNTVFANVTIWESLSAGFAYGIINGFTYASFPKDEFSSPYATEGVGQRDFFFTNLSVNYSFPHVFASIGIANSANFLDSENDSLRFPFWNFDGAANNLSTIYLSLTGVVSIDGSGVTFL
ncbi:MAG: hypothetical protein KC416_02505 [Myxococcales bacterium]|nr:hypothetical protein [Myxococcales bacterium]